MLLPQGKDTIVCRGHSCDMAFHILTFENAYNPGYSAVRKGDPYRMTGMHTGHESVEYKLEKWNKDKKEYTYLSTLWDLLSKFSSEVIGYVDFIYDPFWVRNILYYRTGGEGWNGYAKYFTLTIEE